MPRIHPCIVAVFAGLARLASGQDASPLPEDAAKLKTAYQESMEKATGPLHDRYLADLRRVMDTTTRAGKLEAATAIKQEIDAETPEAAPAPALTESLKLPDEALRLQHAYQQATKQAAEPVRQRYLADLKRLLDQAARAGKLEEATAMKAEMDEVTASAIDTVGEFERRLAGTSWVWNNVYRFTFVAGGKTSGGRKFTWKTLKPFAIEYQFADGYHGNIAFERGLTRATIEDTAPNGKKKALVMPRAKE